MFCLECIFSLLMSAYDHSATAPSCSVVPPQVMLGLVKVRGFYEILTSDSWKILEVKISW